MIESFFEGVIRREDRDQRLTTIDDGIRLAQDTLAREAVGTSVDTEALIEAFAPLADWQYWTRDQKRLVLSTLVPDIRVADYNVESLGLSSTLLSNENTRMGRGNFMLNGHCFICRCWLYDKSRPGKPLHVASNHRATQARVSP